MESALSVTPPETTATPLAFRIERRGGRNILIDSLGCRPATLAEIEFYVRLREVEAQLTDALEFIELYADVNDKGGPNVAMSLATSIRRVLGVKE